VSGEAFWSSLTTLDEVRTAAAGCEACDLWKLGTQTVFGEGPQDARLMLVGEQPGDQEDLQGHPFVGPAGRVLDEALAAAQLARDQVYVTNAVKHFKWTPRGKRRIHATPNREEILSCRPWLEKELALVHPDVLVLLGASAAQALLGWSFRLTQHVGESLDDTGLAPHVLATAHPSSILRLPDPVEREEARDRLLAAMRQAARLLEPTPPG
jgi:uracil-DNA glycosylase